MVRSWFVVPGTPYIGAYGNSARGHLAMMLGMVGKDAGLQGDGPYQDMVDDVTNADSWQACSRVK